MSPWRAESFAVALAGSEIAFASAATGARSEAVPSALGELSMDMPAQRVEALRAWLVERLAALGLANRTLQWTCTGELSRVWTLAVPEGVASRRELQEVARVRCVETFGIQASSWHLAADWRMADSLPCWAVPSWTAALGPHGRTPVPVLAHALAALPGRLPRQGWAVVLLPQSAALLQVERGIVIQVRALPIGVDQPDGRARIAGELRRQRLRAGDESPLEPPWIDARQLADGARTDVAFAALLACNARAGLPVWRRTRSQWALGAASTPAQRTLGLATVALATAATGWAVLGAARATQAAQVSEVRLEAARAAAVPKRTASAPAMALSAVQRQRLNAAIRQLNAPWNDVLDALEAGMPANVQITSIESSGDHPTVRLQAVGPDIDTLLSYVSTLAQAPAFTRADLVQQEPANGPLPPRLTFELALRQAQGGHK